MRDVTITVTNDVTYDQRMIRIATALVDSKGYQVEIVGRQLQNQYHDNYAFRIKRLRCVFNKGFLFYLEFNIRLWWYLIRSKRDILYTCDADTILAGGVYLMSKGLPAVYDAHEYYIESPEISQRPIVKAVWKVIERMFIHRYRLHLTVNDSLSNILGELYGVKFHIIRNLPYRVDHALPPTKKKIIIYQGVVNIGRGLEVLIEAMGGVSSYTLWIVGHGDIFDKIGTQVETLAYKDRIVLWGKVVPSELEKLTKQARYGYNLLEGVSPNYYYSLANKFFDYMKYGVPSLNSAFPEYIQYCKKYECGAIVGSLTPQAIVETIMKLDNHEPQYHKMSVNGINSHQQILNWEVEQEKMISLVDLL